MKRPKWKIVGNRRPETLAEVLQLLLENRGVGPAFLNGSLKDLEPFLAIQGLTQGADLLAHHLSRGHKIVLVGDYDCDGITSAAQLSLFLRDIGYLNYRVIIPDRPEGYGVPQRAILENPDANLLVALDCGTQDVAAITLARSRDMDCIVIDHHELPEHGLAPANVLINPKQPCCPSSFKEFSSAGLTLLFLAALRRTLRTIAPQPSLGSKYLALAAIGTVADIVPLIDANRILTKAGLQHLGSEEFVPLKEMIALSGLAGKRLTSGHIGYYLGPRLNVAGRMASAQLAFDLLTGEDPEVIHRIAQELNRLNSRRQREEEAALDVVRHRCAEIASANRTFVMGDPNWPSGIIGIIASRIQQELHYGPTVIFSIDEELGIARGSARSIPGYDVHAALKRCEKHLIKWGGHRMAAGLTISADEIETFAASFEQIAVEHPQELFTPQAKVDMELDLALVSKDLLETLKVLEPHGQGNPTPTFAAKKVTTKVQMVFGKDRNHLRLLLDDSVAGVFWRGHNLHCWEAGDCMDVVFQVEWDNFLKKPILNIKETGNLF